MTRLCPYEDLNAEQREQLLGIEVLPEQLPFSGDIACALYSLPAQCHPGIRGFALLIDERPVAFMLLKRHPLLAHWADAGSATLHALQVHRQVQGQGLGKICLRLLTQDIQHYWPDVSQLMLSVSPDNTSALAFYLSQGWSERGEAYRGERRLVLPLTPLQAKPAA
ncbi:GNAT family N-acetyltransferase [Pseudomonas helleri]|uniref:GNAT family N-acetyltransferase n=1 Tax=Pseudomonas helleri TaxID=1608996 RepID=A0A6A7YEV8_9PSED|nr:MULTISPECIES: GNAT family N-acetyltransferase [Pseudomonas]MQT30580.1 GNAT family N-acetyltransferase [Pseudomonas helleri]MQT47789.1 GNAT family N-acetyltransferase [Pseudomonas helleri]MQT56820.1 GNAT family N-acetyltransferase [Pseudomonas sp. FSL R10-0399]MQT90905.1 GNAT family N-acetyltransferase [Pseudomonas helleri]